MKLDYSQRKCFPKNQLMQAKGYVPKKLGEKEHADSGRNDQVTEQRETWPKYVSWTRAISSWGEEWQRKFHRAHQNEEHWSHKEICQSRKWESAPGTEFPRLSMTTDTSQEEATFKPNQQVLRCRGDESFKFYYLTLFTEKKQLNIS